MRPRVWVDGEVRAAGGLVLRSGDAGPEVAVIHRPHRDDWSFPKGHLEVGETPLDAAIREVEEETGLRCRPLEALDPVRYIDHHGHPKVVDYWTMEVTSGDFRANPEADQLVWLGFDDAAARLSYEVDRALVRRLGRVGP